ncbi:hypothetical protein IPC1147_02995 [Pseudomonas aeruginosa]|uniref:nitronate monooxygenase n=1 Tax=Pseudomonas aeruginosa TaxID=287 RepID=UPI000FFF2CBE|nr:nitronate monooxygenase [Pseudomonas aeruginosa]MDI3556121.1 nitronate monooxygenase [Pseudomonas aeruginosa]RRS26815.1 hypothetical protein IPC1107_02995 [Pseudomonas aeruginosa]RRS29540.1 hypothetical protein IPC1147_02995 [Pseudomonas aeruginosa]
MSTVPVVACGGIASRAALVAALALGVQGVSCGSAFLTTHEVNAHDYHKRQLLQASACETVVSERFFRNWPMSAPVRVLPNTVTRGQHDALYVTRSSPIIGEQDGMPIHLFSTDSPLRNARGELADMPIYAGQSWGQIQHVCSAAERVAQLMDQARDTLERLSCTRPEGPTTPSAPDYKQSLVSTYTLTLTPGETAATPG